MRKLLCCAASAAALIFAASAADTAAPKKQPPSPAPKPSATKPGVSKTTVKAAPKTAASKTAPRTATTTRTSATRTGVARPAASKTTPSRTVATRRTTTAAAASAVRRPVVTWRNRQASPTTDRYKEIQDALVAKGYLQADDANGRWDTNSVEALKRFQAEQNLDSSGKINSLSLIALGLGPKYDSTPTPKPSEVPNYIQQERRGSRPRADPSTDKLPGRPLSAVR